jgi:hypothetical protein
MKIVLLRSKNPDMLYFISCRCFIRRIEMEDVISLIKHLLTTRYSIDTIDSIVNHLNFSKVHLLQLIDENPYKDYFQFLRPSNDQNQSSEKLALTLDVSLKDIKKNQGLYF